MSVPTTIFIDTSIFDESTYNFESATMGAFKESIAEIGLVLLMPDPTIREIRRHMRERTEAAVATLDSAARKAPSLRKLPEWLLANKTTSTLVYELSRIVSKEFEDFLRLFELVELDYEGIKISEIMEWRDLLLPPFSEKKKGEFPDAFAVASIQQYRNSYDESVAIISKDIDFRNVCERFPGLMYFPSLAAYSEALKSSDNRLASIQAALVENRQKLSEAISEEFTNSGFTIEANWEGDVSDVEITNSEELNFHVLGIGEETCTVAFEGEVEYSAHVSYDDLDSATYEKGVPIVIHHTIEGTVEESAEISGIIMLRIREKGAQIEEIDSVVLDQGDFTIYDHRNDY